MTELTRRRMLAAAGAAGVVAAAGCSSSAQEDDEGENEPEGTELGEISLENVDDEEHTIDVLVEFDREIEHWTTHELAAKSEPTAESGATLERDWSTDPGAFRVTFRLDEGDPRQVTPDYFNDPPSCLDLEAKIERDGTLRVRGGPCGSTDPELDGDEDDE